ncbi:MAG: M48 family metalloprotease [Acidobacteria bacterium]|nr:M48 family metalloprotease [Acidobacteriota bacterium]
MHQLKTFVYSLLACLLISGLGRAETPALSSITVNPDAVVAGNRVEGAVTLNMAAPFDVEVSLAADPENSASIPPQVVVPAGATSAKFPIRTSVPDFSLGGDDLKVTIYGNYGVTKHASFQALPPVSSTQTIDRIVEREREFVAQMKHMHPVVETYIQNLEQNKNHKLAATSDQYFLGRLDLSEGPDEQLFEDPHAGIGLRDYFLNPFTGIFSRKFMPQGFAQMIMLDSDFQKSHYDFTPVRREFLGDVRCLVIDVQPKESAPKGLFVGRIWVEDKELTIVRFQGTYTPHSRYSYYLHFDSWRSNLPPGQWLPAYVYIEESDEKRTTAPFHSLYLKAQTRLWGYDIGSLKHQQEFSEIQVDAVEDQSVAVEDAAPMEAQRRWEQLAADNVADHLEKVGLMAPTGEVDRILQNTVNNLIVANNLAIVPEVRCRVLLTSPLESFTIGHTIVLSRGLLDVLPDEASLALVLAHELGHVVLGHSANTTFAFSDRFFFPDQNTFERMNFERNRPDEQAADRKAMELLANSPYKDQLQNAGLFLEAIRASAPSLTSLIRPHLGNSLSGANDALRSALAGRTRVPVSPSTAIATLPLGTRIVIDPWTNQLRMTKAKPVAPVVAGEGNMPFEITPFFPYLTRLSTHQNEPLALK